ncbi:MAG: cytochrome c oxidase subunit II [Longimicrobiales bacterium]
MSKYGRVLGRAAAAAALALGSLLLGACAGEYPQTTFRPVSDFGRDLNQLFANIFWLTMVVLVVVLAGVVYIILRFRERPGVPEPKRIYGNNLLELLWTLGPAVIVVLITVPTVRTIFQTYRSPREDALQVQAIGHQWWWEFRIPELGIRTANQLYLPVGREIDLHLSSVDVLHNWWVPRLGGKRYNYPNPVTPAGDEERPNHHRLIFTVDEPGVYAGQCAEYCGLSHALMQMRVVAVRAAEFEAWTTRMATAAQPQPQAAEPSGLLDTIPGGEPQPETPVLAPALQATSPNVPAEGTLERRGHDIFMSRTCVACHAIAGTTAQGQLGPDLTNFGNRWAIGAGALPNAPENIVRWVRRPERYKPGAQMPGTVFGGGGMPPTGLTRDELEAVAAYLYSLR